MRWAICYTYESLLQQNSIIQSLTPYLTEMLRNHFDPFGGAKLRPLGRCVKRRSGSTQSKPQHLCWGVEGLTGWLLNFLAPYRKRNP